MNLCRKSLIEVKVHSRSLGALYLPLHRTYSMIRTDRTTLRLSDIGKIPLEAFNYFILPYYYPSMMAKLEALFKLYDRDKFLLGTLIPLTLLTFYRCLGGSSRTNYRKPLVGANMPLFKVLLPLYGHLGGGFQTNYRKPLVGAIICLSSSTVIGTKLSRR